MRKGYFFTLDAFLALGIIIAGVIIIYSSNPRSTPREQAMDYASDLIIRLSSNISIAESNNDYINKLLIENKIRNPESTVMEQAAIFYFEDRTNLAEAMLKNLTASVVQSQYGVAFLINGTMIYERLSMPDLKRNILTSRNVLAGVYNSTDMWGPYTAEVRIYQ